VLASSATFGDSGFDGMRARSAPTFQRVTPLMWAGCGKWPDRDHRQTVAGDIAKSTETTGSRTCAEAGNESN
jgi:hypothetical protein